MRKLKALQDIDQATKGADRDKGETFVAPDDRAQELVDSGQAEYVEEPPAYEPALKDA